MGLGDIFHHHHHHREGGSRDKSECSQSEEEKQDCHHRVKPDKPPCKTGSSKEPVEVTVNVNIGSLGYCAIKTGPGSGTVTETGPGQKPGRPVHNTGTSDGSLGGGLAGPGGITGIASRPSDVWPGPRSKLWLPFLFIRATPGDLAARPIQGVFWESPDILILPDVAPSAAPAIPNTLGGVAKSGVANTVYAHVWNLGMASAWGAIVEFYWFNPTLGFNSAAANLIGKTTVNLPGRGNPGSHALVKCPSAWKANYENGGHECLVVRISQPVTDPLSSPPWDASQNRHIGQRNIHVMSAAEAAAKPTVGVNIGPTFGQAATVNVDRAEPTTMPWLHLATNSRTKLPGAGAATGDFGITQAITSGGGLPKLGAVPDPRGAGLIGNATNVNGDDKQVGFVATDDAPGAGNAHIYRLSGQQGGTTFGGYTVVVLDQ